MKIRKKVVGNLTKCYCVSPLHYKGRDCLLVAAEKEDPCNIYDLDGNFIETVWDKPGGTMSMVQVPGSSGQFLATHKFYSPNDSADACIVIATPTNEGWSIQKLVDLPFVHRFDIISRNGINYLIACTLKSAHGYTDDWSSPGKVYAAVLPEKLDLAYPLEMTIIYEGLTKNHGYTRTSEDGVDFAVVSAEQGIFCFTPPISDESAWDIKQLIDAPTSDALLYDLDMDGVSEIFSLSPFHGDTVKILRYDGDGYHAVYSNDNSTPFLHAICSGEIDGKKAIFIGYRKGKQGLDAYVFDNKSKTYQAIEVDSGCGPANVYFYQHDGCDRLIATNRETDEIAIYTFSK